MRRVGLDDELRQAQAREQARRIPVGRDVHRVAAAGRPCAADARNHAFCRIHREPRNVDLTADTRLTGLDLEHHLGVLVDGPEPAEAVELHARLAAVIEDRYSLVQDVEGADRLIVVEGVEDRDVGAENALHHEQVAVGRIVGQTRDREPDERRVDGVAVGVDVVNDTLVPTADEVAIAGLVIGHAALRDPGKRAADGVARLAQARRAELVEAVVAADRNAPKVARQGVERSIGRPLADRVVDRVACLGAVRSELVVQVVAAGHTEVGKPDVAADRRDTPAVGEVGIELRKHVSHRQRAARRRTIRHRRQVLGAGLAALRGALLVPGQPGERRLAQ